ASARGGRQAGGDYLVTFDVDPRRGTLRELQCLTNEVHSRCASAPLATQSQLLVASDSRSVYVGDSVSGAIDVYRVDAGGLVLAPWLAAAPHQGQTCTIASLLAPGGVAGLAETRDGSELYAGGPVGNGAERILELRRDQASGLLTAMSGNGHCVSDE